ncbi:glycosyltransferase family 25 protein [Pseudoalteromonas sp. MMG013]|uniref:glycosyltransferase family 25 protein n=1 Tax=Pseudoalteromonas sp. MMG013 TaxID=2822687 RepID=UPI001B371B99|nr:glycosyltransferase family 25 protein [Pseudoalteromonas sp. MMG013]MBQ4860276.1 glycosyltransferase family 25 protein [Pseudoalteromonas sp. MMG013]
MSNIVPPIFLINLDQSTQRLKACSDRLNQQSLSFERISGVYGKSLSYDELHRHYSTNLNSKKYHRALSQGEIGCYLSHRKAWQTIVDRKLDYAIVIEDDFKLVGNLHDVFNTIKNLNFDWQLIKLAAYENRKKPIAYSQKLNGLFSLVIHKKAMTGCCAQAISLEGAKRLLEASEQFARPVDTDIQHIWETAVPVYSIMPYYIEQAGEFESDIAKASSNTPIKKHFWKRKWHQFQEKRLNMIATRDVIKALKNSA